MFARLVLAYVLSLPLFISLAATTSEPVPSHTLIVTMASTVPGVVQVFFDSGLGFSETQSSKVSSTASEQPREYRLSLPAGRYRFLRLDPGTLPGRYAIVRAVVATSEGVTEAVIPIAALDPAHQLTTIERTTSRLVVETTPGATDPQIVYAPTEPLSIGSNVGGRLKIVRQVGLISVGAFLLVLLLERLLLMAWTDTPRSLRRLWSGAQAQPRRTVLVVALLASVTATYPVLFLGRSLVSPNNGGKGMLYGVPPLAPASSDVEMEDTRDSDTAAAMYAFVPYSNVQREALQSGEWPLWNRYNAAGRPLWGQGQTFLLDPLHWFTLITPDPALGWDLKFVAHRLVFAIGIGFAALAVTQSWLPSAICAFSAPFVGEYTYRLNHPAAFTMTYVPWALFSWFLLARATETWMRARAAALLAIATSLVLLAAPPKEAVIALAGACIAGTIGVFLAPGGWPHLWRRLLAAAIAGTAMVLVTAPHWLVFLNTLHASATLYDTPYIQVGGVPNAVALFLGPLAPGKLLPGIHALSLVLVVAVLTAPLSVFQRRELLGCAVVVAAFAAVAFGIIPGRWVVRLPFVANIGHVYDVFLTATWPMLLVLSAAGAGVLLTANFGRALAVSALTAIAAWWIVSHATALSPTSSFEPKIAFLELVLAVLLPGCLAAIHFKRGGVLQIVAASAAILVLVLPGGLHARSGLGRLDALLLQPRTRVPLDANSPAVDSVHRESTEPARTVGVDWVLFPGSQAMYELESLGGPDALRLANYQDLFTTADVWIGWGWFNRVPVPDVARLAPLLDMLNTEFLLARPEDIPPGFVDVKVAGVDRLRIGRRTSAWPRAFFADGVTTYADAADLLRRVAASDRPLAAIQSGDRQAVDAASHVTRPSGMIVPASRYRLTVNSTQFHVTTTGPGVAVLGESYLPDDFRVTINGQRVGYFRVDHIFKGVAIPSAGDWEVLFEYRPAHWGLSLILAGIGLVVMAGLGLASKAPRPAAAN